MKFLQEWINSTIGKKGSTLDRYYSEDDVAENEKLKAELEKNQKQLLNCQTEKADLEKKVFSLQNELQKISKKNEELENQIKNLVSNPTDIPSADITYRRPVLVGDKQYAYSQVDVRTFLMPDFLIEKEVKKMIYTGSEDLDYLIPKVYLKAKEKYKYGNDIKFGFSELWMYPYEVREVLSRGLGVDCDDWAIMIGSYFAAAGIPRNKWFVSAGETRSGFGHATIYALASDGKWRHLNSTKEDYSWDDLKKYPLKDDEKDLIGIHPDKFWFSFNDFISISKFETTEARKGFKESILNDKIKIEKK